LVAETTGHRSVAVREYERTGERTGQAMKRKASETIQLCETKDNTCVKKPCTNVMVSPKKNAKSDGISITLNINI